MITYQELKIILNTLNDEQLLENIRVGTEMGTVEVDSIFIAEEDMINPSGDGMEEISSYAHDPTFIENEPVVLRKGYPILLGILI